jgi:isopentenyl diphosphate isomerase/L-lactate dehydrogenase-like FMN-dependent dehydrogenase
MMPDKNSRRRFLRLLATSPILPLLQCSPWLQQAWAEDIDPLGLAPSVLKSLDDYNNGITSAAMAVDVFDLERVAQRNLHVGHNAYLAGGEDQATLRANRDGFKRYELRPRRLMPVDNIDMSMKLFGTKWETPIILCPVGRQRAFNAEAELPVARAAKATKHLMTLSTGADSTIEDVAAARGEPVWFQLYGSPDWSVTKAMIKRAEAAGSPVMVFTVDSEGGSNREIVTKVRRQNLQFCQQCHKVDARDRDLAGDNNVAFSDQNAAFHEQKPPMMLTKPSGTPALEKGSPTWDYVKRLKDTTSMKVLVKGISADEDGQLAMEHGADGVWLSNHGGRVENSGRSTVECIPEMVAAVAGRGPVIVDSGFRRGSDIFKALALGATAVGIGRPYIWGLASFGQEGVEAALRILRTELRLTMQQLGTPGVGAINKNFIVERHW